MCGRFALTASPQEVAALFGTLEAEPFPPRYNIAPTQPILMAQINPVGLRETILVRWGLVPGWVKDPGEFSLLVNARSETAAQKPSFRNAMRHRRTLIPTTGFYEWFRPGDKKNAKKQAYWIRPREGGNAAFGGLMETWSSAEGSEIDSGCILTTRSNKQIGNIHHRMPVIIKPEDFEEWLDCKTREPRDVAHLMEPIEDGYFEAIAVSDLVNKVANSGPEIQNEIDPASIRDEPETQMPDKQAASSQLDLF